MLAYPDVGCRRTITASREGAIAAPSSGTLALALALTHVMIERGWYDDDFVRRWTNSPLLVRADTGRLLRAGDLSLPGDPAHYVVWDGVGAQPAVYDPSRGRHAVDPSRLALFGSRIWTRAMPR